MSQIPKPKRLEDNDLIARIQSLPCCACEIGDGVKKSIQRHCVRPMRLSDAHHLTTRGAGGHDAEDNLIALCRTHHQEAHSKGMRYMCKKYSGVREWLTRIGREEFLMPK